MQAIVSRHFRRRFSALSSRIYYKDLAHTWNKIEKESSRDAGITHLQHLFQNIMKHNDKADLLAAIHLSNSQLAPAYDGMELHFRYLSLVPAFSSLIPPDKNVSVEDLMSQVQKKGDLGTVVRSLCNKNLLPLSNNNNDDDDKDLSIHQVLYDLRNMSLISGAGSVLKKQEAAISLLKRCKTTNEIVYLSRFIAHQKLRIGMGQASVLSALAKCFWEDKEWSRGFIQSAFSQRPCYETLLAAFETCKKNDRVEECISSHCTPVPGIPLQAMSGYPVASIDDILTRMKSTPFSCEYKYDGERIQIHIENTKLEAFSRNSEPFRLTYLSELLKCLRTAGLSSNVQSCILEGEVVAVDRTSPSLKLLPFQTLQTNVNESVCLFVFDVLYKNGRSMLSEPYAKRLEELQNVITPVPGYVELVKNREMSGAPTASELVLMAEFMNSAVTDRCEGLMIKSLAAPYVAGKRSFNWLKIKKDYMVKSSKKSSNGVFLPDTLDLVPVGASFGKGRRAGSYGSFLMACYDDKTDTYETIGKLGTGFTDQQLQEFTNILKECAIDSPPKNANVGNAKVDVWFTPSVVWEVRAAQLSESRLYTAGKNVSSATGISMRFPRFIKERADKDCAQATSSQQLLDMLLEASTAA